MTQLPVLAAATWRTNAELIAALVHLQYLNESDRVFDATYGRGVWWKQWRPEQLVTNDLDPTTATMFHEDFTATHWPDHHFDVAAFDPPYAAHGGRATSTIPDFNARYGRHTAPATPELIQAQINTGLAEMVRIVRPTGLILVKCQAYIWSGRLYEGDAHTRNHAVDQLGCIVVDRLEHVGRARPQPARTRADGVPSRQHHARRNLSTLFVLRTPRSA